MFPVSFPAGMQTRQWLKSASHHSVLYVALDGCGAFLPVGRGFAQTKEHTLPSCDRHTSNRGYL